MLVLRHAACEGPGRIVPPLAARGIAVREVRADRGEQIPPRLGQAHGLIVLGGPQAVYEQDRHPFLVEEIKLIQRALDHGRPVLGICLGAELLAAAMGAVVRKSDETEIGWLPVSLNEEAARDPLLGGAPREFTALHWHGDVFDLPVGATTLASSQRTQHQAFRAGHAWGLLFHIEADAHHVAGMADTFASELAAAGVDPAALIERSYPGADALAPIADGVFTRYANLLNR